MAEKIATRAAYGEALVALAEEGGRQVVPDALVGPGNQDGCHASVPLSWKNRWTWR